MLLLLCSLLLLLLCRLPLGSLRSLVPLFWLGLLGLGLLGLGLLHRGLRELLGQVGLCLGPHLSFCRLLHLCLRLRLGLCLCLGVVVPGLLLLLAYRERHS